MLAKISFSKAVVLLFSQILLISCISYHDKPIQRDESKSNKLTSLEESHNPVAGKNYDLVIIKLENRVSELEQKLSSLSQKYKILEKGLTLGLIPKEMTPDFSLNKKKIGSSISTKGHRINHTISKKTKTVNESSPILTSSKKENYSDDLKKALLLYNQKNYQKALHAFQQVTISHPESMENGNHLYWLGMCWFHLNDSLKAKFHLGNLTKNYPENSNFRKASYYLALIDIDSGMTKSGVEALESLIKALPDDEISKLAHKKISELENNM